MLLRAVGEWERAFLQVPNQVVVWRPDLAVGHGPRRSDAERIAPVSPNEIVRARQGRHLHPDEGRAVGVPLVNFVRKREKSAGIRETQITAGTGRKLPVEKSRQIRAEGDQGGKVVEGLVPIVASETNFHSRAEVRRLESNGAEGRGSGRPGTAAVIGGVRSKEIVRACREIVEGDGEVEGGEVRVHANELAVLPR